MSGQCEIAFGPDPHYFYALIALGSLDFVASPVSVGLEAEWAALSSFLPNSGRQLPAMYAPDSILMSR